MSKKKHGVRPSSAIVDVPGLSQERTHYRADHGIGAYVPTAQYERRLSKIEESLIWHTPQVRKSDARLDEERDRRAALAEQERSSGVLDELRRYQRTIVRAKQQEPHAYWLYIWYCEEQRSLRFIGARMRCAHGTVKRKWLPYMRDTLRALFRQRYGRDAGNSFPFPPLDT